MVVFDRGRLTGWPVAWLREMAAVGGDVLRDAGGDDAGGLAGRPGPLGVEAVGRLEKRQCTGCW